MRTPPRPKIKRISLSVQYAEGVENSAPSRPQVRRWALAAAQQNLSATIRFVGNKEARALNAQFRAKDYATNVLTFPYEEVDVGGFIQGDIAICVDVIQKEARQQKKTAHAHFAHMVVHGMLHMQGYDHETEPDAREMEALETQLLRRFRIADPYESR